MQECGIFFSVSVPVGDGSDNTTEVLLSHTSIFLNLAVTVP